MARRLNVYRIPIGFHDAYVAAPTQKAAIEAWGADEDAFRRGRAEKVEDPALTEEPLARPGEVVKRLRGTEAEQIAALGAVGSGPKSASERRSARPKKPKPRPSRAALDRAEAALAAAADRHEKAIEAIRERAAALERERAQLEAKQAKEREKLEARAAKAAKAYEEKMEKWRKG